MKRSFLFSCLLLGCSSRMDVIDADVSLDASDAAVDAEMFECDPMRERTCVGDEVHACDGGDIDDDVVETCGFEACVGGECLEPCAAARSRGDSIGCEYWATDLDNAVEILGLASRDDCSRYGNGVEAQERRVCENLDPFAARTEMFIDCPATGRCAGAGFGEPDTSCEERNVCILDAQGAKYGLAIANPDPGHDAEVTVTDAAGATATLSVVGGGAATFFPVDAGLADQSLDGTGVVRGAYHVESSRPVVVYQLNPVHDESVASNDGSLLLAAHALGTEYVLATAPSMTVYPYDPYAWEGTVPFAATYAGYATIVATSEGTTSVTIDANATVVGGEGFEELRQGQSRTVDLEQFETLTLEAEAHYNPLHPAPVDDGDLTGTRVEATRPIAIFVGHEASVLSEDMRAPTCCADHLEEQLLPTSTWGTSYAIARSAPRGAADRVRIVAAVDDTRITFDPPLLDGCQTLAAGEFCDANVSGDIDIEASHPVLVMQFLLSAGPRLSTEDFMLRAGTIPDSGDPSMSFAVPNEQFRASYTFLVPGQFTASYLFVSAMPGEVVTLDGEPIDSKLVTTGDSPIRKGRILVPSGPHRIECPSTCSAQVAGWSTGVSYMFPAGLRLQQIAVF